MEKDTIVLHHSAIQSEKDQFKQIVDYHLAKWPKMKNSSYHVFIERSGEIIWANDLDSITYHAGSWNERAIGICLAGHLSLQGITPEQRNSLKIAVNTVKGLRRIKHIYNHREVRPTICPSVDLRAVYESSEWDSSPPIVHKSCGVVLRSVDRGIHRAKGEAKKMLERRKKRLIARDSC